MMKATIVSALVFGGLLIAWSQAAPSEPATRRAVREQTQSEAVEALEARHPRAEDLAAYLVEVVSSWPHAKIPAVAPEELARDIADVALENSPAWDDDINANRSAVLLASLAYWEGARFAAYVDDQSVNRWMREHRSGKRLSAEAARLLHFGNADGGYAYSLWQIHPFDIESPRVTPQDLADRKTAARVALSLARASIRGTGTLCWYTGEYAPCPKARERLEFALSAIKRFPYSAR